jgi:hypothetical protein
MERNVNCSKLPKHRATEEAERGGKDGLDMQDGRKKPQTDVVKSRLQDSQIWYGLWYVTELRVWRHLSNSVVTLL